MRKSAYLLLLSGLAVASLQADVIYSNFGVSPADPYDPSNGLTVADGGTDNRLSFSFVIPASPRYQLTGIDFAAFLTSGTNAIIANVYDDNGGVPGNLVYTTGEIDNGLQAPQPEGPPDPTVFNEDFDEVVTNGPILTPGATYWLTLDAAMVDGGYDSSIAWSYNGQEASGNYAFLTPDGWIQGMREQGVFEIDAALAPAPEPITTVMFGSGLAMVVFLNRRRFIKTPGR